MLGLGSCELDKSQIFGAVSCLMRFKSQIFRADVLVCNDCIQLNQRCQQDLRIYIYVYVYKIHQNIIYFGIAASVMPRVYSV